MTRGVHHAHVVCRGGSQVDVVIAGTGAHDDFQVFGGVEHLGVDDVAAHDDAFDIFHGFEQFGFFTVFFEEHQFQSGTFDFFFDTFYRNGCKRFVGCN